MAPTTPLGAARAEFLHRRLTDEDGAPNVEQLIRRGKESWGWTRAVTEKALNTLATDGRITLTPDLTVKVLDEPAEVAS